MLTNRSTVKRCLEGRLQCFVRVSQDKGAYRTLSDQLMFKIFLQRHILQLSSLRTSHTYTKLEPINARIFGPVYQYNYGSRGKNLSEAGKGIPDMYVSFRFGTKLPF